MGGNGNDMLVRKEGWGTVCWLCVGEGVLVVCVCGGGGGGGLVFPRYF